IDPVLESSLLRNRLPLIYLWGKEVLKVNSDLELKNLEDKFLSNNELVKDPFISPYYADLTGLPPIFLNVGEIEILKDDSVKFYEKGINSGLDIKVKVWKDMIHVFIAFLGVIPEAIECLNEMSEFINKYSDI
ncbi:MAG: alpha/beta hydrolase, partial [Candidatus Sericytochromatia bacterium]